MLSSLRILCNDEPFLNQTVTCNQKWILYNWWWPAQCLDQEVPKHFPKPDSHMVTVWWSAAGLIHYGFLNPGKTITSEKYAQQIDEMHQKLNTPAASIGQQKGSRSSPWQRPATWCTTSVSKVERIGLWSFASSAILTWPLANWLPLLQTPLQDTEWFPKIRQILRPEFLHYRNKLLFGKNVLTVMVPILINKDAFELVTMILNSWSEATITFVPT